MIIPVLAFLYGTARDGDDRQGDRAGGATFQPFILPVLPRANEIITARSTALHRQCVLTAAARRKGQNAKSRQTAQQRLQPGRRPLPCPHPFKMSC